jgi:PAS domain S-box-containing protein
MRIDIMTDNSVSHSQPNDLLFACARSRQALEAIINSIADGIVVVGKDMTVSFANKPACELLERTLGDLIGKSCVEIFSPDGSAARCPLADEERRSLRILNRSEAVLATPSGREICVLLTTTKLLSDDGLKTGYVVAIHDISELMQLRQDLSVKFDFHGIIGRSGKMKDLIRMIERIASGKSAVLGAGETGTGKELIAGAIHAAGDRASGPLVKVNCAALPETLLESELFGHVKGAFTGAERNRIGRFEQAGGGTIFLDEISEIPPSAQVKLLRVLQEHSMERVGESVSRNVDVRIIAATNMDLEERIRTGRFREDLYYRLNTIILRVPPLRERREDIALLAEFFLGKMNEEEAKATKKFHSDCYPVLLEAEYPGNVRQLQHAVEYAWYHSTSDMILPFDLPDDLLEKPIKMTPFPAEPPLPRRRDASVRPTGDLAGIGPEDDEESVRIRESLVKNRWNLGKTSDELGMHRTTLWRKMRKYGMET